MRHIPRKRFGQNFLIDQGVILEIINQIHPTREDRLIEIGPGLGALTRPLLARLNELQVIEIDRDIVARLERDFSGSNLVIHHADALKFDFSRVGEKLRIVGNLPYNISTPLLFHLASFARHIQDMHFMLQQEVVDRMVAKPSTSEYGRLSLMLQYRYEMERLLQVSAECFHPVPKVQSAVISLRPRTRLLISPEHESLFADIVSAAFSQRRKTLRNTMRNYLGDADYDSLQIDPGLRAENLTLENFSAITCYLADRK
ncbi:MAG: 16S rRNA (adenine(1518)-N(6)/adenine(1519)-N(6))-dimethyltransferase RsmA [Nitrosomonas sp.]|jgi:16S rRNA (adenine1518-N6/adenine1519-N6)-dimethyltransferase|nr:16S rRNA (adenine(1518)-N(6)/adenine(1519)-N(6))-dimethyltransferase RsmA [Nitrosomonas sp.]MCC7135492.1 16S rRNA (adenine(1518)-N(6)/adenine(1519)-N(6))-dimethyltransferase RsmA [Nitrosomonas sp.]